MTQRIDWVASGWGHRPTTVDDVLFAVNRMGTWSPGRRYAFRGVKNHSWPIQSSLQRFVAQHHGSDRVHDESWIRAAEREVVKAARSWELDDGGQASDQLLLARLQHHGSPTRLLDVTSDPMTALWFATEPLSEHGAHGVVFAFDLTDVPELTPDPPMSYGSLADPHGWHFQQALDASISNSRPFVIHPFPRDQRMTAQQGYFLAGAVPENPSVPGLEAFPMTAAPPGAARLDELFGERHRGFPAKIPFVAIIVPRGLKTRLRVALASTWNRRRETLFPDLAGLADALRDEPERISPDIPASTATP